MTGGAERQIWGKIPDALSRALGCAAVLYVWGFFVFRARLNALGVPPSPIPVVDQTYLIQGGGFIVVTLDLMVANWRLALLCLAVGIGAAFAIRRWRRQVGQPGWRAGRWAHRLRRLLMTVLAVGALTGSTLLARSILRTSGPLLLPFHEAELTGGPQVGSYFAAVMLAIAGGLLLAEGWRTPSLLLAPRFALALGLGLAVLDGCLLPMAFGSAIQHPAYSVVTVETEASDEPKTLGALVLATEKIVVVYTGSALRLIPAEKVTAIDVLCESRLAKNPSCPGSVGAHPGAAIGQR